MAMGLRAHQACPLTLPFTVDRGQWPPFILTHWAGGLKALQKRRHTVIGKIG